MDNSYSVDLNSNEIEIILCAIDDLELFLMQDKDLQEIKNLLKKMKPYSNFTIKKIDKILKDRRATK